MSQVLKYSAGSAHLFGRQIALQPGLKGRYPASARVSTIATEVRKSVQTHRFLLYVTESFQLIQRVLRIALTQVSQTLNLLQTVRTGPQPAVDAKRGNAQALGLTMFIEAGRQFVAGVVQQT
ncbi:MAG: hypothetical protein A3B67_15135 [Burkholderiales bacterium RIFCSPHIGHO2_02_FULL_66_10]|nr:MAG: hypothetical protein A3B67_15135 [Burkholderiales bacterium RIFCSPHIGHO2_02_FULL_66_10]